jgi:hypothetical protein
LAWGNSTLLSSLHRSRKGCPQEYFAAGLEESIFVTLDAAGDHFVGPHLANVHHEPPDADRSRDREHDGRCMKKRMAAEVNEIVS